MTYFWSHLKALGAQGLQTQPPLNRSPGPILDPQNHQIPSRTQLATDCVGILVGKTWDPAHRFGGKLCLVLGSRTGPLKLHGSYCKLNKWAQIWAQNIGPNLAPRNSKYSVPFAAPGQPLLVATWVCLEFCCSEDPNPSTQTDPASLDNHPRSLPWQQNAQQSLARSLTGSKNKPNAWPEALLAAK